MTIKQMIKKLLEFNPEQEIRICCYTSINDPEEMVVFNSFVDKNGNTPCQICMDITNIGLETDGKTVCIY